MLPGESGPARKLLSVKPKRLIPPLRLTRPGFLFQFPVISEFGENANSYCSFESKETALLHSENDGLQQRVNALTHEVRGPLPPAGIFKIKA